MVLFRHGHVSLSLPTNKKLFLRGRRAYRSELVKGTNSSLSCIPRPAARRLRVCNDGFAVPFSSLLNMHPDRFLSVHCKLIIPNMSVQVTQAERLPRIAGKGFHSGFYTADVCKIILHSVAYFLAYGRISIHHQNFSFYGNHSCRVKYSF